MTRGRRRRAARGRQERRLGVEIVELAFALPVMMVIVFGTLETCELIFVKQSLAVGAYESGRIAARPGGTADSAVTRFEQIMTSRRVNDATITITPADPTAVAIGDEIRIEVAAPVHSNSTTGLVLTNVPDITETVVVVRE
ncbi:TadE-like protein [Planctomycetes bacterium MalM25]|nr:TadE-like protein [Planctomycetes bacterium MalM25]